MHQVVITRWRANFLTGLAVLLPALITLALVKWLFGTIASVTDLLLFFLPKALTHADEGRGSVHWYWSLAALALGVALVAGVGWLTRYYVGKRIVQWLDQTMLRLPLLNKIYSTIKQVNEAFSSSKKTAFKTVVLIEYPRPGVYSIGFITSEQNSEVQARTREPVVCVFVPTTPNPTSGFLVLVPADQVVKLDMPVADAIRYVISLGSVAPEFNLPGTPGRELPPSDGNAPLEKRVKPPATARDAGTP